MMPSGALLTLADGSRRAATACSSGELAEAAALLSASIHGPYWLAAAFDALNAAAFGGTTPRPAFRLAELPPGWFGAHEHVPGAAGAVLVHAGLLTGQLTGVRPGRAFAAGRRILAADVVAHEAVHVRLAQLTGDPDGGHGRPFQAEAAAIAPVMGLPAPSTTAQAEFWPVGLCSPGRYGGAFVAAG